MRHLLIINRTLLSFLYGFVYLMQIYIAAPAQNNGGMSLCKLSNDLNSTVLECKLNRGQELNYKDIREWAANEQKGKFIVRVVCDKGTVYLPWPFKASNVIGLEIYGCSVRGFLSEMTMKHAIKDELKLLILSKVNIDIPFKDMLELKSKLDRIPWETDCGQMTLEKLIIKDVHYDLKMTPEERDGMRQISIGNMEPGHHETHMPCIYKELKYIDESGSRKSGQYHLKLVPEDSKFPKLEIYNMSRNDLSHVPNAFRNLHSDKFPSLRQLDFSNNFLRSFEFEFPKDLKSCHLEKVDVRNNLITHIPAETAIQLTSIGSVLIDLRNNPLRCTCRLDPLRQYLISIYKKSSDINVRQLLYDITCKNDSAHARQSSNISIMDDVFKTKCQR